MGGGNVSRYYFTTWCEQKGKSRSWPMKWAKIWNGTQARWRYQAEVPGPWLSTSNDYLPKMFVWITCRNDFGKRMNFVVADGQTLHIVFLLTYGSESVRHHEQKLWDESRRVCSSQRRRDNVLVNTQVSEYNIYSHSGDSSSCRHSMARCRGTWCNVRCGCTQIYSCAIFSQNGSRSMY